MNSPSGTVIGAAMRRFGWAAAPDDCAWLELGRRVGNLDYAVVSKAIARFEQRRRTDPQLRQRLARVQLQLSK